MTKWRTAALVVVVDFLLGILLMQQAILALSTIQTQVPHIQTYGQYAVEITWPQDKSDIDLYVQDPSGNVAYFANANAGEMHLEHDDLGSKATSYTGAKVNFERTVLRGVQAGEYTTNVHYYWQSKVGGVKITVRLYSLRGQDKMVVEKTVVLRNQGDEKTAFRFTLNRAGDVTGTNDLQKSLVGTGQNTSQRGDPHGYGYGGPGAPH